ncbi:MAG: hypothetical protein MHM6MM_003397, partial [Cercozoa sp. M6MM]
MGTPPNDHVSGDASADEGSNNWIEVDTRFLLEQALQVSASSVLLFFFLVQIHAQKVHPIPRPSLKFAFHRFGCCVCCLLLIRSVDPHGVLDIYPHWVHKALLDAASMLLVGTALTTCHLVIRSSSAGLNDHTLRRWSFRVSAILAPLLCAAVVASDILS